MAGTLLSLVDLCIRVVVCRENDIRKVANIVPIREKLHKVLDQNKQMEYLLEYKEWYDNDQLKKHCHYIGMCLTHPSISADGSDEIVVYQYHGDSITWYSDGRKCHHEVYFEGKKHGPNILWNTDGKMISNHNYVLGKRDGEQTDYYRERIITYNLSNEQIHGERVKLKRGKIKSIVQFVHGLRHGHKTVFYENGKVDK